jgi:hypothetical protein
MNLLGAIAVIDTTNWELVEQPGYIGKQRESKYAEWNKYYGLDGWQLAWQWGNQYLPLPVALSIYEDAYYHFLLSNPDILEQLATQASDVYDDAPSNVSSGLDYTHQETNLNHWHDIAIRRALLRNGQWFAGRELVHIRHEQSTHPLSMLLSPGQVPFHRPELIAQPELERWWWQTGSVESFYQSNKVLLRRIS